MHRMGVEKKDPKIALQEDMDQLAHRHNLVMFGFACLRADGTREMLQVMPDATPMSLECCAGSWFDDMTADERTALADAFKAVLLLQLRAKGLA
jgi:hypothetical protein